MGVPLLALYLLQGKTSLQVSVLFPAGVSKSVNIRHIKVHYFSSHPKLNYYAIMPVGSESDPWWEKPHDRAERFGQKS